MKETTQTTTGKDDSQIPLVRVEIGAHEADMTEWQRLERQILEISEREQCRLGQDLHDGLSQELAGVALLGKVLANTLEAESHPLAQAAADIATYTSEIIGSARRLAKGLYPVDLTLYGLFPALENLAEQTSMRLGISCKLQRCVAPLKLPQSAEIHLYRIIQECIGNAIKHGGAQSIIIESFVGDGVHTFTVTDDGLGFEKPAKNSGLGLDLMNYRARLIGATIEVRKPAEGGCRITCRIPV